MTLRGELTITFATDWHCGTGTAEHGGVDRLINRDASGLPFIPISTLRGIWRDACETAANALDEQFDAGAWHQLADLIFGHRDATGAPLLTGSPLDVGSAQLSADWRGHLAADPAAESLLVKNLTRHRMTTAIDETTGTAATATLRTIEFARAGLTLTAPYTISIDDQDAAWAVEFLLGCGLELMGALDANGLQLDLGHFGAGRRRGAGRCRVSATGLASPSDTAETNQEAIADFQCPERLTWPRTIDLTSAPDSRPIDQLQHVADLEFCLLENAVGGGAVIGNALESSEFIPGSALLPLLRDSMGAVLAALIRTNQVVITDANVVISGRRATPVPRCLESGHKGEQWKDNGFIDDSRVPDPERETNSRPVSGWCVSDRRQVEVAKVRLRNEAKNAIDDQLQRPETLYTIRSIEAGTVLRAQLWLPSGVDHGLQDGEVKLGRLRNKGFGRATMRIITDLPHRPKIDDTHFWDTGDGFVLSFVLESDTCLVDAGGAHVPTAERLVAELSQALDTELTLIPTMTKVAVKRRESWTTQMLPKPSVLALAAGSVISVLAGVTVQDGWATPAIELDRLRAVLDQGVGALRPEGFGRLAILPLTTWAAIEGSPQSQQTQRTTVCGLEEPPAWLEFVRLTWADELRRRIRMLGAVSEVRKELVPASITSSQAGTLRDAARALAEDPNAIATWLGSIESHKGKSANWGGSRKLLSGLGSPADDPESWSRRLADYVNNKLPSEQPPVPTDLGGNSAPLAASWLLTEFVRQSVRDRQRNRASSKTETEVRP